MVMGADVVDVTVGGVNLECVKEFVYLGSLITADNNCRKEIRRRIGIANGAFGSLHKLWKSKNVSMLVKLRVLDACVMSTLLYACESWTLLKADVQRLNAFEMKCYRRMLGIKWTEHEKNDEIRRRLKRFKLISETVKERKLGLFGHICRMKDARLVKLAMFGTVEGKRKRGRPRRRWGDDVVEWTGMNLQKAAWAAQNREGFWRQRK